MLWVGFLPRHTICHCDWFSAPDSSPKIPYKAQISRKYRMTSKALKSPEGVKYELGPLLAHIDVVNHRMLVTLRVAKPVR